MGWAGAIENERLREEIKRLRGLNEFYRQTYEKLMSNKTIKKALDKAITEGSIISYGMSSYGGGVEDMGSFVVVNKKNKNRGDSDGRNKCIRERR